MRQSFDLAPDSSTNGERLSALFTSKEGGAKVVLKVNILDLPRGSNEESYNFTCVNLRSFLLGGAHPKIYI